MSGSSGMHSRQAPGLTLTWENINVYAPSKEGFMTRMLRCRWKSKNLKQILSNVSGMAEPGTCLAIMGASGAGKTTLLNTLTHRNQSDLVVEGEICVNGSRVDAKLMPRISGYVQQDDILLGQLTVREHLWFQAELRMNRDLTKEDRDAAVHSVMEEMGLLGSADVMIGVPGLHKGISGGERKRLCFASEVLTNPTILFCDEPTSGLDSFMAINVVKLMRKLASRGRAILCTIHQPSSETFALFDRLLLMGTGGRVAYLGPAEDALKFFQECAFPCPRNFNPADHFITTLAKKPGQEEESQAQIEAICDKYELSGNAAHVQNTISHMKESEQNVSMMVDFQKDTPAYKQGWRVQLMMLYWRTWTILIRDRETLSSLLIQTLGNAAFYSILYHGQGLHVTQRTIININGVLFISLMVNAFACVYAVIASLFTEYRIFIKENFDGMYRTSVYFFTKTTIDSLKYIILIVLYVLVLFLSVGFHLQVLPYMMLTFILMTLTCMAFGYLVACSHCAVDVVISIAGLVFSPLYLIAGFFIDTETIPLYFLWLKYISWFTYANEMLMLGQWSSVHNITCDLFVSDGNSTYTCFQNGQEVLQQLSMADGDFWLDALALVILMLVLYLSALCLLVFRINRMRAK